jgi:hypothetical protein
MKKAILAFAAMFCIITATAQEKAQVTIGNGHTTKETRQVGNFDKINVKGPFDIRLVSGDQGKVSVEADNNIIEMVTTEVKDGVLNIGPMEGKLFKSSKGNKVIVRVPVNNVSEIALLGSGTVTGKTTLKNNVKLTLDGSGKIEMALNADNAEAVVLGSGDITVKGTAANFKCLVVGSGMVKAETLEAANVDVTVSGTGNAKVYTVQAITGRITGSGNVAFVGNPKERDLKRTGTGDFINL